MAREPNKNGPGKSKPIRIGSGPHPLFLIAWAVTFALFGAMVFHSGDPTPKQPETEQTP